MGHQARGRGAPRAEGPANAPPPASVLDLDGAVARVERGIELRWEEARVALMRQHERLAQAMVGEWSTCYVAMRYEYQRGPPRVVAQLPVEHTRRVTVDQQQVGHLTLALRPPAPVLAPIVHQVVAPAAALAPPVNPSADSPSEAYVRYGKTAEWAAIASTAAAVGPRDCQEFGVIGYQCAEFIAHTVESEAMTAVMPILHWLRTSGVLTEDNAVWRQAAATTHHQAAAEPYAFVGMPVPLVPVPVPVGEGLWKVGLPRVHRSQVRELADGQLRRVAGLPPIDDDHRGFKCAFPGKATLPSTQSLATDRNEYGRDLHVCNNGLGCRQINMRGPLVFVCPTASEVRRARRGDYVIIPDVGPGGRWQPRRHEKEAYYQAVYSNAMLWVAPGEEVIEVQVWTDGANPAMEGVKRLATMSGYLALRLEAQVGAELPATFVTPWGERVNLPADVHTAVDGAVAMASSSTTDVCSLLKVAIMRYPHTLSVSLQKPYVAALTASILAMVGPEVAGRLVTETAVAVRMHEVVQQDVDVLGNLAGNSWVAEFGALYRKAKADASRGSARDVELFRHAPVTNRELFGVYARTQAVRALQPHAEALVMRAWATRGAVAATAFRGLGTLRAATARAAARAPWALTVHTPPAAVTRTTGEVVGAAAARARGALGEVAYAWTDGARPDLGLGRVQDGLSRAWSQAQMRWAHAARPASRRLTNKALVWASKGREAYGGVRGLGPILAHRVQEFRTRVPTSRGCPWCQWYGQSPCPHTWRGYVAAHGGVRATIRRQAIVFETRIRSWFTRARTSVPQAGGHVAARAQNTVQEARSFYARVHATLDGLRTVWRCAKMAWSVASTVWGVAMVLKEYHDRHSAPVQRAPRSVSSSTAMAAAAPFACVDVGALLRGAQQAWQAVSGTSMVPRLYHSPTLAIGGWLLALVVCGTAGAVALSRPAVPRENGPTSWGWAWWRWWVSYALCATTSVGFTAIQARLDSVSTSLGVQGRTTVATAWMDFSVLWFCPLFEEAMKRALGSAYVWAVIAFEAANDVSRRGWRGVVWTPVRAAVHHGLLWGFPFPVALVLHHMLNIPTSTFATPPVAEPNSAAPFAVVQCCLAALVLLPAAVLAYQA